MNTAAEPQKDTLAVPRPLKAVGSVKSFPELIAKKRDGESLSAQDIQRMVDGIVSGDLQEAQIGKVLYVTNK